MIKEIWSFEVVIKYSTEDEPVNMIFLDDWGDEDEWVMPHLVKIIEEYHSSSGSAKKC